MGPNEKALVGIANATDYDIPALEKFLAELEGTAETLKSTIGKLEGTWEGTGADQAKEVLSRLRGEFFDVVDTASRLRPVITAANRSVVNARSSIDGLPSVEVPDWIYHSTDAGNYLGFAFPAVGGASLVAKFLQQRREDAAADALAQLHVELDHERAQMASITEAVRSIPIEPPPGDDAFREPAAVDQSGSTGGTGGSGPGGGGLPSGSGSGALTSTWTPTPLPRDPSKDGDLDPKGPTDTKQPTGVTPTPLPKPITGGGGGGGGGVFTGIGGAGAAAGLAAAARAGGLGAGGMGGGGLGAAGAAGARLGSGLSGSAGGLAGAGSGAGGAAGGSAAGAGGRGGSTVMGGGAGGAGGKEKEARSGLGGLIAPKLEDDEELGPRSAAADAGGREE